MQKFTCYLFFVYSTRWIGEISFCNVNRNFTESIICMNQLKSNAKFNCTLYFENEFHWKFNWCWFTSGHELFAFVCKYNYNADYSAINRFFFISLAINLNDKWIHRIDGQNQRESLNVTLSMWLFGWPHRYIVTSNAIMWH